MASRIRIPAAASSARSAAGDPAEAEASRERSDLRRMETQVSKAASDSVMAETGRMAVQKTAGKIRPSRAEAGLKRFMNEIPKVMESVSSRVSSSLTAYDDINKAKVTLVSYMLN